VHANDESMDWNAKGSIEARLSDITSAKVSIALVLALAVFILVDVRTHRSDALRDRARLADTLGWGQIGRAHV
jgi:hypothetical protein